MYAESGPENLFEEPIIIEDHFPYSIPQEEPIIIEDHFPYSIPQEEPIIIEDPFRPYS